MTPDQMKILIRIDQRVEQLLESHQDHEERLRSLETFKNWAAGIGAVIGAVLGIHSTSN